MTVDNLKFAAVISANFNNATEEVGVSILFYHINQIIKKLLAVWNLPIIISLVYRNFQLSF
ncbi:Putative uncharacterized protein [Lactobacillus delbrueckii subsp. lactis]|nr:Putative uncharacterized protein [Lactobacillus delbrueckii subsp. lactis]